MRDPRGRLSAATRDGIVRLLIVGGNWAATVLVTSFPLPSPCPRLLDRCRWSAMPRDRRWCAPNMPPLASRPVCSLYHRLSRRAALGAPRHRAGGRRRPSPAAPARPAVFLPYPHAMDDPQTYNVGDLVAAGGAISIQQSGLKSRCARRAYPAHGARSQRARRGLPTRAAAACPMRPRPCRPCRKLAAPPMMDVIASVPAQRAWCRRRARRTDARRCDRYRHHPLHRHRRHQRRIAG